MSGWVERPIDQLCDSIVDCVNRTAPIAERPTPYRMIRTTNVRGGFIDLSETRFVDEDTFKKWTRRQMPMPGDIVLTREAPLGEVGIIRPGEHVFLGQRLVSYRTNPDLLDNRFLLYFLLSAEGKSQILSFGMGATVAHMRVPDAKNLKIPVPPINTQRRIAAILAAYDDLIEVNRRRIVVLEEMARGLFSEWFIRLRFPGHEDLAIEETADGPRPTEWRWGVAGDLLQFDPRTQVPRDGEKPFIPMGHLDTATSLIAEPEMRTGNFGAKFQNHDTLFARITPCLENGKTGLVRNLPGLDGVGFGSTEFIVMRAGRAGPAFSYCLSRLPAFREHARMSMSGASGRQRARTDSVADFPIAIPPTNNLFEQFEKAAWPMLELVGQIGISNQRLVTARDLLLPRLITGQLSVAETEQELETA